MSMTKEQILEAAKGLDLDERMDVVDGLLASLSPEEQREIDKASADLAEKRLDALERGETQSVPGDEVFDELRAKYS